MEQGDSVGRLDVARLLDVEPSISEDRLTLSDEPRVPDNPTLSDKLADSALVVSLRLVEGVGGDVDGFVAVLGSSEVVVFVMER